MTRFVSQLCLSLTIALAAASAAAQGASPATPPASTAAPAASDAPYREGTVWELSYIRTVPGLGDDYLKSLAGTWKKVMDEAKKQGIVVSYKILSGSAASADDWDLLLMVEYKSFASLDGLDAKMRAIEAKAVGTPDQMKTLMTQRLEVRQILGGKLTQELILK